jgi:acyl dehydratase
MTSDSSDAAPRLIVDPPDRYLSDFRLGDRVVTRGRTVEQSDISAFAGLVGNFYPLHVDAQYAESTRFESRVAHGSLIYSIAVGLVELAGFYGNSVVAMVGVTDLVPTAPTRAGDTIHVSAEVTELVPSTSRPGGRMAVTYTVINQHDQPVLSFVQTNLMRGRAK